MRAAGARSRNRRGCLGLVDGSDLRRNAQALDVGAFPSGGKARAWNPEGTAIIEGVVVGHLSKTASVHTQNR